MATLTKEQIYCEMQKEWVKLTGAKVGDIVRVTRTWKKGDQGFIYGRIGTVGQELTILRITENSIDLSDLGGYPYFALEWVSEKPQEITIGGGRKVTKSGDNIVCGCCTLTPAKAKEAIKAFETLSKIFESYSFSMNVEGSEISRENIAAIKSSL